MNKEEVLEEFCKLSELVGRVKFNHLYPYDCFCGKNKDIRGYMYGEEILTFISEAVNEKLERSKQ